MNKSRLPHLLSPFDLRGLPLRNRVVMAPLTRARAGRERVANDLMAEYYTQRASAGLIITGLPRDVHLRRQTTERLQLAYLIAFGRPYLSNPDLVERFAHGWDVNPPADLKVWSAPTAAGYTDSPFHPATRHS